MLSIHKISGDAAGGFAVYLTTGSSRGDYYIGGDADAALGEWHGSDQALAELGLSHDRPVERDELIALMAGLSPRTAEPVRAVGGDGSRVAGIDLTFSAPKSVSALWAVSGPYRRAQIEAAHRNAVASGRARIERDVALVRRREDGRLRWETARGLVAAEFVHSSSRLTRDQETDGVPDPQLHSHLVVVAAERHDGRFAAVDSRELLRAARSSGAWYRAELAYRLGELGLEVRRRTGREGRFFELAGVPEALSRRWSSRTDEIDRAARRFRDRYGRAPRAGELAGMTIATRGTKSVLARVDVDAAWHAVGEEYGLGARRAEALFDERARHEERDIATELLGELARERSMVDRRELDARVFELAAGIERPARARERAAELERSGELVALEGGWWTTRELRALEHATLDRAAGRCDASVGAVSARTRTAAAAAAERRLGARLTAEQVGALEVLAGRGGVVVLVGEAGTGKGVVIGAARDAWEREDHRVIGIAVAGATAKRLGQEAQIAETMTADALVSRYERGQRRLDERSVVVMDEAGMADTRRLERVVSIAQESGAKLVLVGDGAQLSPLGAGGLFAQLEEHLPSARLSEVHRARHDWERQAWSQVRSGDAELTLAEYHARDRLHLEETRVEAGERMVADWDATRDEHPGERVLMLTDASNDELDRLNSLAQAHRAARGELGQQRVELPGRPYALAAGDEVLLTGQLRPPGQERLENGTRADVMRVDAETQRVLIRTDEPRPRDVEFGAREFADVRLAYAQHVYKAQGATVDRSLVLLGGWQTDRERAYVALTRARERTDVYIARDDLGAEGLDAGGIERLARRIGESRAQQASVTRAELRPERERGRGESEIERVLREQREQRRERGIEDGLGID